MLVAAHVRERHGLLCMPNLSDLGTDTGCGGAARRTTEERGLVDWSKCDAFCFGLRPFDRLCASAYAARVHHSKPRHVIVRPSQGMDPRFPPVLQDQTPSYDDPSKFGGG